MKACDPGGKGLQALLEQLPKAAQERKQRKIAASQDGDVASAVTPVAANNEPSQGTQKRKPRTPSTKSIVVSSVDELEHLVRARGLEMTDVFPSSEYPTPFTRLPIFPPVRRETAIERYKGGWTPLTCRWSGGGVDRSGPPLTIYDEDTLLGIMMLREYRLKGPASRMPCPVGSRDPNESGNGDSKIEVHALYVRMSQLESAIQGYVPKNGWGGKELAARRQSMEDLSGLQLRFERPIRGAAYQRKIINLFETPLLTKGDDSCYYVQFHPLVVEWLESYRTYIDFDLRRKLSPLGRAIHRFLASQRSNRTYRIALSALIEAIGAELDERQIKYRCAKQLQTMQEHGLFHSFSLSGTGRSTPHELCVVFRAS